MPQTLINLTRILEMLRFVLLLGCPGMPHILIKCQWKLYEMIMFYSCSGVPEYPKPLYSPIKIIGKALVFTAVRLPQDVPNPL